MEKYKVAVAMSTYNGEKFLKQQIESILNQKEVEIQLYIRDDGSTDNTGKILCNYSDYKNIHIQYGENLGSTESFWRLVMQDYSTDFFAFSDQDDVWNQDKLKKACEKISNNSRIPQLYFSSLNVTDEELNLLSVKDLTPNLNIGAALITNRAYGCTIVINKCLHDIIKNAKIDYVPEHDTKIYQIAVAIGAEIYYDSDSYISYRQHANNVVGARESLKKRVAKRIRSTIIQRKHIRRKSACALLREFDTLISDENKALIEKIADPGNLFKRIHTISDKQYRSGDRVIDCNFILAYLLKLV